MHSTQFHEIPIETYLTQHIPKINLPGHMGFKTKETIARSQRMKPFGGVLSMSAEDLRQTIQPTGDDVYMERPTTDTNSNFIEESVDYTLRDMKNIRNLYLKKANDILREAAAQNDQQKASTSTMAEKVQTEQSAQDLPSSEEGADKFSAVFGKKPKSFGSSRWASSERKEQQEKSTVRVSNLSPDCVDQGLSHIAKQFGNVTRCFMPKDSNDKGKGYAFIHFDSPSAANSFVEKMNGHRMDSLVLVAELAEDRRKE